MDCTEILESVAKAADIKKIGVLSEADFMSILPSGGKVRQKYRDGSQMVEMTAQIQCRGSDQKGLIHSLEEAAEACCCEETAEEPCCCEDAAAEDCCCEDAEAPAAECCCCAEEKKEEPEA